MCRSHVCCFPRSLPRLALLSLGVPLVALLCLLLATAPAARAQSAPAGAPADASADARADGVPVVIAIDTSRSLDAAALGQVVDRLRLALEALPRDTPTALLGFDDEPRWLVAPWGDPATVAAGLREARLAGGYTLLHDALFTATRALDGGGVVLLASDGRDENSAVTVEDLARRAEAEGIRILTVGTGRAIDELSLRRLAMVTDGAFLGDVRAVDAAALADAVDAAREQVEGQRREAARTQRAGASSGVSSGASSAAPSGAAPSGAAPSGAAPSGAATSGAAPGASADPGGTGSGGGAPSGGDEPALRIPGLDWSWVAAGAVFALLILAFGFLRRSRPASSHDVDLDDAEDVDLERRAEDEAVAASMRQDLLEADVESAGDSAETSVDTQKIQQMTLDERLEKTRVLSSHAMLVVRRPGEAPRSFLLDEQKAFAVGRDRDVNTLALPDPALSARHFKIVPRGPEHFFVDVGSTNGSFIDGRRTTAKRLRAGDRIRAGQVEFEFQSYGNGA